MTVWKRVITMNPLKHVWNECWQKCCAIEMEKPDDLKVFNLILIAQTKFWHFQMRVLFVSNKLTKTDISEYYILNVRYTWGSSLEPLASPILFQDGQPQSHSISKVLKTPLILISPKCMSITDFSSKLQNLILFGIVWGISKL